MGRRETGGGGCCRRSVQWIGLVVVFLLCLLQASVLILVLLGKPGQEEATLFLQSDSAGLRNVTVARSDDWAEAPQADPDPGEQDESMTVQEVVEDPLVEGQDAVLAAQRESADLNASAGSTVGDTKVRHVPDCEGELELDEIQIHIIGWRRPMSLYVLLQQLAATPHGGWSKPIPMHIHVDGDADGLVVNTALGFQWPNGPVHLDIRPSNIGLREMWLSSLTAAAQAAGPNTLMVILEDDMRVSPVYFQWLMSMLRKYARNPTCRDKSLMGFSLSPVRMQELRKPFRRWRAQYELPQRCRSHNTFLSTLPSSWGGTYFTDRWLEFAAFVRVRIQPPFYDIEEEKRANEVSNYDELRLTPSELYLPGGCRSNFWPRSWKRFMVDFMFGRGMVMLYPNVPEENALATTMQFSGAHVQKDKDKGKDEEEVGDSRVRVPRQRDLERNSRVAPLLMDKRGFVQSMKLPTLNDICVRNLFMEPTTRELAVLRGAKFLGALRDLGEVYSMLVQSWQRPEESVSDG